MATSLRRLVIDRFPVEQRDQFRRTLAHNYRGVQHIVLRTLFGSNLKALAYYYGTDKGWPHDYLRVYKTWLGPLRKLPIQLLEIGVGGYDDPMDGGNSVRMWRTYIPKGRIYFPHPACPDPLTPRHALVAQLGRGTRAQLSQEVEFRNRVSPSGPPSLFRPTSPAGALCSTGVTPLQRYYGPLRLPTWPTGGYGFPVGR